jgi:Ca2+-binding EF-hand superfamily protein
MYIKRLALLSCVAIGLAAPALAQGPDGPGGLFKTADTNKDGVVDQGEFQASRDKWFADLDANKDGFVTADELKAFGDKMHAEWAKKHADASGTAKPQDGDRAGRFAERLLQRVDTDKDGRISKAEFDAEGTAMFKRLDNNSDGKIAGDEMPAHRSGNFSQVMFKRIDADNDGKATKAEFEAAADKMFQQMDKNGDGTVTPDEMRMPHRAGGDKGAPAGGPVLDDQAPTP